MATRFKDDTAENLAAAGLSHDANAVLLDAPDPEKIQEDLSAIIGRLEGLARDAVRLKQPIEDRWIRALRRFHGKYEPAIEKDLEEKNQSRAFVRVTRKKTNSWKGRLESLIFPTDDRNYSVQPTPVPTLTTAAKQVVQQAMSLLDQANAQSAQAAQAADANDPAAAEAAMQQAGQTADQAHKVNEQARQLAAEITEAKKRAEAMQREMDDQLVECGYTAEGRDAIANLCQLGTAIMKGPLASEAMRGKWEREAGGEGQEAGPFAYKRTIDPKPVIKWVNPWAYFPDMTAMKKGQEEHELERHLWTKKDLRRLVKESGFNEDSVRELIRGDIRDRTLAEAGLGYLAQLREIDGTTEFLKNRYVGWEYHGPLEAEEIVTMLHAMGDVQGAEHYTQTQDPLVELRVICYFCEGKLLKIAPEFPLDSQESLYSVVPFEPSDSSMFGYGIPDIMEDSQQAMNAAWRMALDNAGLSTGPQIVVDREKVTPANDEWAITPRKIWYKNKSNTPGEAFETFDIPNKVSEIMAIVEAARHFVDDETALPVQSEGEVTDNPNVTATASNIMSLGFNVTFRSVVKAWDDGMTVPTMRRLYDWNMQHSDNEDIKGDMSVDARGTSVLLMREMQSQALSLVIGRDMVSQATALMLKPYETYRQYLQSLMISPDDVMVTKDEWEEAVKNASQGQQDPPQVIAAKLAIEKAKLEGSISLQVAGMNQQTEMIRLAEARNMKLDELTAMMKKVQIDVSSRERMFAAELGADRQAAQEDRAMGLIPKGSGGSFSFGAEKPADQGVPA
jgi:hypothetical protein